MPGHPESARSILHIADGRCPATSRMQEALAGLGLDVSVCKDVHRGLAALVRWSRQPFVAVVVCVEWLDAHEIEFFSVVARYFPAVPVFVYGRVGLPHRAGRPLVGATIRGQIGPEDLDALVQVLRLGPPPPVRRPGPQVDVVEPAGEPPAAVAAEPAQAPVEAAPAGEAPAPEVAEPTVASGAAEPGQVAPAPRPQTVRPEEPEPSGPQASGPASQAELSDRPPVPWAPSPHRPQRIPPSQRANSKPAGDPRAPTSAQPPWLTQQELDALLSDDAAIGPEPRPNEQRPEGSS